MSKHWYTNNIIQVLAEECPEGFKPGRLPVSNETKLKHSKNNAWNNMSEEQKKLRSKKISETISKRTDEEKEIYSKNVSAGRKGKGLGIDPWNKGKKGLQEAWNKGIPTSEETKDKLRAAYNNLSEEEKERRKAIVSAAHKNKTPWNYGLTYTLDPRVIARAKEKEIATKIKNGAFIKSTLEENIYKSLLSIFSADDICRQYFDRNRYPFACDFYIKPLDLFLEINGNWTHGYTPYDASDDYCAAQLAAWEEKALSSDYYKNAIYTWTDLDVRKRKCAKDNNLLYFAIYSENEFNILFEALKEM